jgi:tungstate transport system substrate-binding protein
MTTSSLGRTTSLLLVLACSCRSPEKPSRACPCAERTLRLATTTSVDNTGLLKVLLEPFRERTGIRTHVLSVGTGQAIKVAERGDVDLVLVHDKIAEERFIARGFGLRRIRVMHNDFVLIGPGADPARATGGDVAEALRRIAAARAPFVSRGDESGTHKAELRLWKRAGVSPGGDWYQESGQGQRLNVNMANEKRAYCLTDRATFLDAGKAISLVVLVEGDELLLNPYSAIAVNPARHPHVKHVEAMALIGWLTSAGGQKLIGGFRRGGKQLFHPDVIPAPPRPGAR